MQFGPSMHQFQADGNFSETNTECVQLNGLVSEMEMMQRGKRKVMESRRRTAINKTADICFPLSSCWDTPSNIMPQTLKCPLLFSVLHYKEKT